MRKPERGAAFSAAPAQLALPLRLADHATFATLVAGPNTAAFAHARALAAGQAGGLLWLWGGRGSGKSHALQAACRDAHAAGQRAMYLPLGSAPDIVPRLLTGHDALGFLALDDVEHGAGDAEWERVLFDVLNAFGADGGRALLMAASAAPAALGFALPDLASRAAGASVYRVRALNDAEQLEALQRHARRRGFELTPAAARFLQARVSREMPVLCEWLHKLDAASLAARRRVTIPFIRASLAAESRRSG